MIGIKEKIDITPSSSVYATYGRLSYQPWTALAEFVDNSTQSYFDHAEELRMHCNQNYVEIVIDELNDGTTLVISDNAFGMELDDFKRAIILDKPPLDTSGRHEYGMGLKTAACWFGKKWTVKTTQYGSTKGYVATMDIDKLASDKDTFIEADVFETSSESHYTILNIENLQKKIIGRSSGKVKEFLSSIYRQDLRDKKVKIIYKGSSLTFKDPEIFEEDLDDRTKYLWTKDVAFEVDYEGQKLPVNGFIAIRKKGSLQNAGFTLLRRGRVIVGGPDKNYRPLELFKHANSFAYQRLFGELNMDQWPVTQAKDEFDWHNGGLEESFIIELSKFSEEYRKKSENVSFRRSKSSSDVVKETIEELTSAGIINNADATPIANNGDIEDVVPETEFDYPVADDGIIIPPTQVHLEGPKTYQVTFNHNSKDFIFVFTLDTTVSHKYWLLVAPSSDGHNMYDIQLNMKHPFFIPFINDEHFGKIMMKLAIALTLAEIEARLTAQNGLIDPSDIRIKMNDILESIAKKMKDNE